MSEAIFAGKLRFAQHNALPYDFDKRPFNEYFSETREDISALLSTEIEGFNNQDSLSDAKKYSLGRSGKMIRPILAHMSAELLNVPTNDINPFLVATEKLHNASLDIDDIQDKAKKRRGQPTLHEAFSTDTAVLSSVSLIGAFFSKITELEGRFDASTVLNLSKYCGNKIMHLADGQNRDVAERRGTTRDMLENIARLKTGSAIEMSMVGVAILASASDETQALFKDYAHHLSLVFQTKDDILDATNSANTGKDNGLDAQNRRATLVDLYGGVKNAHDYMDEHRISAKDSALQFPGNPKRFLSLVDFVIYRSQ